MFVFLFNSSISYMCNAFYINLYFVVDYKILNILEFYAISIPIPNILHIKILFNYFVEFLYFCLKYFL